MTGAPSPNGPVTEDTSEEELWYVVCIEAQGKRSLKEIKLKKGQRITFGPMAMGGRFPACWRVYDGKELLVAFSGVVWFHRRDFDIKDYHAV